MCGITAIIGKNVTESMVLPLLYPISHRGEREHFNEAHSSTFGTLAMNRLAIVDRAQARQPFESRDKRFLIIFNGEIYNYKALRSLLKQKDHQFFTDSDTEVLLSAWIEWKESCLLKLRGIFAFVILDQKTGAFFAARDPFGVKPLYWARTENATYFASEIKSLSLLPKIKIVKIVKPGNWVDNCGVHRYFFPFIQTIEQDEVRMIKNIRCLFDQAVEREVQTDLPVGVLLSGGIDSTAVLATARKFHSNVTAIIVGTNTSSDRVTAIRYCEEFCIPYVVEDVPREEELAKQIPEIVRITESFEPNMIRQAAVSLRISRLAHRHGLKIVLCGEGSDELFAGYPEFTFEPEGKKVEGNIQKFLKDLHRTQLQRVDRTSMYYTVEVRVPFLDLDFASYVLTIPGEYKIRYENGKFITKYILRKAMADRLPDYIYCRDKVVLSEGAGLKGNQRIGGLFYDIASANVEAKIFSEIKKNFFRWRIETKEEAYYFSLFKAYGYTKATFNRKRTSVNKNNTIVTDAITNVARRIVDMFGDTRYFHAKPLNTQALYNVVACSVEAGRPIPLVMMWGKGTRDSIGQLERKAKRFLEVMQACIRIFYKPGCTFTVICTDTHAQLNGHSAASVQKYLSSVEKLFSDSTYSCIRLSAVWKQHHKNLSGLVARHPKDQKLKSLLAHAEKKHNHSNNKQSRYYSATLVDKEIIEKEFPLSVFLTYNSPDFNPILPTKLPIVYAYSLEKGEIRKPWFQS